MINASILNFMTNKVWPLMYKFNKNKVSKRCDKCINSEHYVNLVDGVCLECIEFNNADASLPTEPQIKDQETQLQLNQTITDFYGKGKNGFDALVLFSGGKDSTMLVHKLMQEHPQLRILSVTIDNHFLSPMAIKNIEQIVNALNMDHFFYRAGDKIHQRSFAHAVNNVNGRGGAHVIDRMDCDLFHDIAFHLAAKMNIPLVLSGASKEQVNTILEIDTYELPQERLMVRRKKVGVLELSDFAKESDYQHYFWSPEFYQQLPRVLYPNSVWDYSYDKITEVLFKQCGLSTARLDPLVTNYQLIPLIIDIDFRQIGYCSFEPEFAKMVRDGKIDRHNWLNFFQLNEYIFRHTKLFNSTVKDLYKKLEINPLES